jgi:hypothetical protein
VHSRVDDSDYQVQRLGIILASLVKIYPHGELSSSMSDSIVPLCELMLLVPHSAVLKLGGSTGERRKVLSRMPQFSPSSIGVRVTCRSRDSRVLPGRRLASSITR